MPFTVKDWKNAPDTSTPISAEALEDMEERLSVPQASVVYADALGAVGDGASHPLSGVYGTLAAAQAVFPFVTSLTQERDWAALQAAYNSLPEGEDVNLNPPSGGGPSETKYRIKGGGTVSLSKRQFYIGTSSLELTANSFMDATGASIHYTGTGDALVRKGTTPYTLWRCNVKGLTLFSDYTTTSPSSGGRHGVNLLRLSDSHWEDVLVYGFRDDGIVLPEAQWNEFTQVNSVYNGGYGFRWGDSVALETELTEEVTAVAATLPVKATVEVATGLEARIGDYYGEEITYAGTTANSLTGCTRGVNGSRNRLWPSGTKVLIMAAQRSNNNVLDRCRGQANGRGGLFADHAQANSAKGSTMQYSSRETTLTEEATIPGDLKVRSVLKVVSTAGWAPSGWGMLTGAESELFTYESKTETEFKGVMRGMKGSAASAHTIGGTAVRQGVGFHMRGGDDMANDFDGHLEGNAWHSFIEAYNTTTETEPGRPRGTWVRAFFVSSNKVERYMVNHGDGTVAAGSTQANIEANLTRNATKLPFENYVIAGSNGANLTIISFPRINAPAEITEKGIVTDQNGFIGAEGYNGRGIYLGENLHFGRYNFGQIYERLSSGANRQMLSTAGTQSLARWGNTQNPQLLRNAVWHALDIDTTGKTTAQITTSFEAAVGIAPVQGMKFRDHTNHIDLTFDGQSSKWYKSAAATEIV